MSATGPDAVVERHGVPAELVTATDFAIDANGQLDEDSLERETDVIRVVPSQPSEQDEQRHEGRLSTGSLQLTVGSDVDVSADRDGRRDRIYLPPREGYGTAYGDRYGGDPEAALYKVVEVRRDAHPLTGTQKTTVLIDRVGGR